MAVDCPPPKKLLLLSLCEEIHQTGIWLQSQTLSPPADELRYRIQTLREAAMVTGALPVERELADLERELVSRPDATETGAGTLRRLAEALAALERIQAEHALEWLDLLEQSRDKRSEAEQLVRKGVQGLAELSRILLANPQTTSWYPRLQEIGRLADRACACLHDSDDLAETAMGSLGRLMTMQARISLAPMLLRLREHTQQVGVANDRPAALLVEETQLRVHPACVAPLEHILATLFGHLVLHGLEPAQARRRRNRPTVATCRLWLEHRDGVFTCGLSAEGANRVPPPLPDQRLRDELKTLRARLTMTGEVGEQRLLLDFPDCWGAAEALPVSCALGSFWICLEVIEGVISDWRDRPELERIGPARQEDLEDMLSGLHILRSGRDFVLPARIVGSSRWIVVDPPQTEAPAWIAGTARHDRERQVLHPLHWFPPSGEETCIFP